MELRSGAVVVDGEFRSLIPALSTAERDGLEADIKENGCRDSLKVWCEPGVDDRVILLDGHNRYEICQRLGIAYQTDRIALAGRTEAKIWIIRNQLNRRNLSPFARAELALALEPLIAAEAKERQRQGGIEKVRQTSDKPIDTKREVAKLAQVSHDTIAKVKVLSLRAPEAIKEKLRRAETTINKQYRRIVAAEDPAFHTNSETAFAIKGGRTRRQELKVVVANVLQALAVNTAILEEFLAGGALDRDVRKDLAVRKILTARLDRIQEDLKRVRRLLIRGDHGSENDEVDRNGNRKAVRG